MGFRRLLDRRSTSPSWEPASAPVVSVQAHRVAPWTVVRVEGELDARAGPLVEEALGGDPSHVVFDLHRVTYVDVQGIDVLLDRQRRAAATGGRVLLVAPTTPVTTHLDLTRSGPLFLVVDSVDDAVALPLSPAPDDQVTPPRSPDARG